MKCPFGMDHSISWRCFAAYAVDYVLGWDWLPALIAKPLMDLIVWIEQPQ